MPRHQIKPRSKLEAWVRHYGGVTKLGRDLGVNYTAVGHWLAGRATPSLKASYKMIKLSNDYLTIEDILEGTDASKLQNL